MAANDGWYPGKIWGDFWGGLLNRGGGGSAVPNNMSFLGPGGQSVSFNQDTFTPQNLGIKLEDLGVTPGFFYDTASSIVDQLDDISGFDTSGFNDEWLSNLRFDFDLMSDPNNPLGQAVQSGLLDKVALRDIATGPYAEQQLGILRANIGARERALGALDEARFTDEHFQRLMQPLLGEIANTEALDRRQQVMDLRRRGLSSAGQEGEIARRLSEAATKQRIGATNTMQTLQEQQNTQLAAMRSGIEERSDLDTLLSGMLDFQVQADQAAKMAEDLKKMAPTLAMMEMFQMLIQSGTTIIPSLIGTGIF